MAVDHTFGLQENSPVNQIELIQAIFAHLEQKAGITMLNERWTNAVIKGATVICDEFAKPHVPAKPDMGVEAWLRCDETGTSSRAMAWHMYPEFRMLNGIGPAKADAYPVDPSDFGRCMGLMKAASDTPERLEAMREVSPAWTRLVNEWDDLVRIFERDEPTGTSKELFRRLQAIDKEAGTR